MDHALPDPVDIAVICWYIDIMGPVTSLVSLSQCVMEPTVDSAMI